MVMSRLFTLAPTDDPAQAHLIRRFLAAAVTSLLVMLLMLLLHSQGYLERTGLVVASSTIAAFVLSFYSVFRSGLNLRASDPSLTAEQMICSILVVTYAMYYAAPAGRGVLLLTYPVIFLFGVLRLDTRRLMQLAVFAIACQGALIGAMVAWRPGTFDVRVSLVRWVVLGAILIWFALMGGYISQLRKRASKNLSELRIALETSRGIATRDELTGLYNRRFLMDLLEQEKGRSDRSRMPFSICLLDVDHFKKVNDVFGHLTGDQVLRGFSRALLPQMRITDYFGRYGGEEFMMILPQTQIEEARVCAERFRSTIENFRFPKPAPDIRLTVSIGIARYEVGESLETTIHRADIALYKAKEAGRNRVEIGLRET